MLSEPRKYGCTVQLAVRNSEKLKSAPAAAASRVQMPSRVPAPTSSSSAITPMPVSGISGIATWVRTGPIGDCCAKPCI
jgi:hypothetical protein